MPSQKSLAIPNAARLTDILLMPIREIGPVPVLGLVMCLVVMLSVLGCGDVTTQSDIVRAASAEGNAIVPLGETGMVDNFAVTIVGVRSTNARDEAVREIDIRVPEPAENNVYILIDVSVENVGDEVEIISSRQKINLFDSEQRTQRWSLVPISEGTIDGRIEPGRERHGELVWEVSEDAEDLTLVFDDTVFAVGDVSSFRAGQSS